MPWKRPEEIFEGSLEDVLKTSWRHLEDVFKTSWRRLEDVLKASWRHMAKTNILVLTKTSWRRLEDVFWRHKAKANILVLIKTSSEDEDERRLQDVFKTSSSRRMFAGNHPDSFAFRSSEFFFCNIITTYTFLSLSHIWHVNIFLLWFMSLTRIWRISFFIFQPRWHTVKYIVIIFRLSFWK